MIKFFEKNQTILILYKNTVEVYSTDMQYKGSVSNESIVIDAVMMENGYIVTGCDDKLINVFDEQFNKIKHIKLSKKPSSINEIENTILVADKFGDVYQFKMDDFIPVEEDSEKKKDELPNHIIIAHFSLINEVEISKRKNAIITCDRDEKIRVTRYPRTDIIQSFCYGFVELITSCKSEIVANKQIIAAGGCDGSLRIFEIANGTELTMKQFGQKDVVIIYDMKVNENVLEMLVGIESKYAMIMKSTFDENGVFGEFTIEKIDLVIKGGKFINDDIVVYLKNDTLQYLRANKIVELQKKDANEQLSNEGIIYEASRKAISPKDRFIHCDIEDDIQKVEK